jgi:hypothetical protein
MVGDESAALAHRSWEACGGVYSGLQLELSVYLGTKEDDVEGNVEPQ